MRTYLLAAAFVVISATCSMAETLSPMDDYDPLSPLGFGAFGLLAGIIWLGFWLRKKSQKSQKSNQHIAAQYLPSRPLNADRH